jgi:hypothetical protein
MTKQHKQHRPLALSICWDWSSTLIMVLENPSKTCNVLPSCKCLGMYTSCWVKGVWYDNSKHKSFVLQHVPLEVALTTPSLQYIFEPYALTKTWKYS